MDASLVMTDWPGVVRGPSDSDDASNTPTEFPGSISEQRNLGSLSVGNGNGTEIAPWLSGDNMPVSLNTVASNYVEFSLTGWFA
jgi:hypothetical protein